LFVYTISLNKVWSYFILFNFFLFVFYAYDNLLSYSAFNFYSWIEYILPSTTSDYISSFNSIFSIKLTSLTPWIIPGNVIELSSITNYVDLAALTNVL
jgi:hypothetical protein